MFSMRRFGFVESEYATYSPPDSRSRGLCSEIVVPCGVTTKATYNHSPKSLRRTIAQIVARLFEYRHIDRIFHSPRGIVRRCNIPPRSDCRIPDP